MVLGEGVCTCSALYIRVRQRKLLLTVIKFKKVTQTYSPF